MSRKAGERIHIGPDIQIDIIETGRNRVRVGITAPKNLKIEKTLIPDGEPQINWPARYVEERSRRRG